MIRATKYICLLSAFLICLEGVRRLIAAFLVFVVRVDGFYAGLLDLLSTCFVGFAIVPIMKSKYFIDFKFIFSGRYRELEGVLWVGVYLLIITQLATHTNIFCDPPNEEICRMDPSYCNQDPYIICHGHER